MSVSEILVDTVTWFTQAAARLVSGSKFVFGAWWDIHIGSVSAVGFEPSGSLTCANDGPRMLNVAAFGQAGENARSFR